MRALLQVIFAGLSFAASFASGLFFGAYFPDVAAHAKNHYGGKPLPYSTELFAMNPWLATVLMTLPWFIFLGLPLLAPASRVMGKDTFVARNLAFLSIEFWATLYMIHALAAPYLPFYPRLDLPEITWQERIQFGISSAAGALLGSVVVIGMFRKFKPRNR